MAEELLAAYAIPEITGAVAGDAFLPGALAGLAGAGEVAGDAFLPGALSGFAGMDAIPETTSSALLGSSGGSALDALGFSSPYMTMGQALTGPGASLFGPPLEGIAQPGFARGAATVGQGIAGEFGPIARAAETSRKIGLSGDKALLLAQMLGAAGGGQQQPIGAPTPSADPNVRAQMATQEEITKKWLMKNDPNTYARIYGAPQG